MSIWPLTLSQNLPDVVSNGAVAEVVVATKSVAEGAQAESVGFRDDWGRVGYGNGGGMAKSQGSVGDQGGRVGEQGGRMGDQGCLSDREPVAVAETAIAESMSEAAAIANSVAKTAAVANSVAKAAAVAESMTKAAAVAESVAEGAVPEAAAQTVPVAAKSAVAKAGDAAFLGGFLAGKGDGAESEDQAHLAQTKTFIQFSFS